MTASLYPFDLVHLGIRSQCTCGFCNKISAHGGYFVCSSLNVHVAECANPDMWYLLPCAIAHYVVSVAVTFSYLLKSC